MTSPFPTSRRTHVEVRLDEREDLRRSITPAPARGDDLRGSGDHRRADRHPVRLRRPLQRFDPRPARDVHEHDARRTATARRATPVTPRRGTASDRAATGQEIRSALQPVPRRGQQPVRLGNQPGRTPNLRGYQQRPFEPGLGMSTSASGERRQLRERAMSPFVTLRLLTRGAAR